MRTFGLMSLGILATPAPETGTNLAANKTGFDPSFASTIGRDNADAPHGQLDSSGVSAGLATSAQVATFGGKHASSEFGLDIAAPASGIA